MAVTAIGTRHVVMVVFAVGTHLVVMIVTRL